MGQYITIQNIRQQKFHQVAHVSSTSARPSIKASAKASASVSARDNIRDHSISQSFDLPTATTSVSHLTCPLPPHQSVI